MDGKKDGLLTIKTHPTANTILQLHQVTPAPTTPFSAISSRVHLDRKYRICGSVSVSLQQTEGKYSIAPFSGC
jgi:hypothetical protein